MFYYSIIFAMLLCGNVFSTTSTAPASTNQSSKFITRFEEMINKVRRNVSLNLDSNIESELENLDLNDFTEDDQQKIELPTEKEINQLDPWGIESNIYLIKQLLCKLHRDDKGWFCEPTISGLRYKVYFKTLRIEIPTISWSTEYYDYKQSWIYFLDTEVYCNNKLLPHYSFYVYARTIDEKNYKFWNILDIDKFYDYATTPGFNNKLEVKLVDKGKNVEFELRQLNISLNSVAKRLSKYATYTVKISREDYHKIKEDMFQWECVTKPPIKIISCKQGQADLTNQVELCASIQKAFDKRTDNGRSFRQVILTVVKKK